jgi:hypothetical protein
MISTFHNDKIKKPANLKGNNPEAIRGGRLNYEYWKGEQK